MTETPSLSGCLELPHLSTFVGVAELGSFTALAADLHITQAAVSQRIAALEGGLRVSLFHRRARRVTLTEAGLAALASTLAKYLSLHEQARKRTRRLSSVRLRRPAHCGKLGPWGSFFGGLLSAFHAKYPQVHVRATVSDSSSVMERCREGQSVARSHRAEAREIDP